MTYFRNTLWIEMRKATRSKVLLFSAVGFMLMPVMCALMIFIYKDPDLALKLGLISAKAQMFVGGADWPGYLNLLTQSAAIGGLFLFCLVISWVFGREFADGAVQDMLAVPVPRGSILLAKFVVAALWSAALALEIYLAGMALGAAIGLPGGTPAALAQSSAILANSVGLVIVLTMPFAFLASVGRGYLLPLGAVVLTLILANVAAVMGWGEYFPWSAPGLASQGLSLPPVSYVIVALTGLAGVAATYFWWKYADQSR